MNRKNEVMVLFVVLLAAAIPTILLFSYRAKYQRLNSAYDRTLDNYEETEDECNFYREFAVIVPDDGSGLYHRYGCIECDVDNYRFNIFNIDLAEGEGYDPCPECII